MNGSSGMLVLRGNCLEVRPVLLQHGMGRHLLQGYEGLGLLLAVDIIPDMFVTVANVTADMTVATVLSRQTDAVTEGSRVLAN